MGTMTQIDASPACAACGRELSTKQGRGRPQQYCNATCRSAARRRRDRTGSTLIEIVNDPLTPGQRHDNLDVMDDTDSGAAAETPASGTPLAAVAEARQLAAMADAALQQAVD